MKQLLLLVCCLYSLPLAVSQMNSTSDNGGEPVEGLNATVVPIEQPACYDNLTQVSLDISRKSPFEVRRYILCTNTVFTGLLWE